MKKGLLVSSLILALSLFAGACESMDNKANPAVDSKAKVSDSDIENAVKAKWSADSVVRGSDLSIDADADKNTATVSGTVTAEAVRTRAVELAKGARAGMVITDKIDVKPREVSRADYTEDNARTEREKASKYGEKLGSSLDDAWIHTKIVAKLISDSDTPQRKINVDVVNNTVTLRGAVNTADQKSEAERVAKETEGVKRVVNQLRVDKNA